MLFFKGIRSTGHNAIGRGFCEVARIQCRVLQQHKRMVVVAKKKKK